MTCILQALQSHFAVPCAWRWASLAARRKRALCHAAWANAAGIARVLRGARSGVHGRRPELHTRRIGDTGAGRYDRRARPRGRHGLSGKHVKEAKRELGLDA